MTVLRVTTGSNINGGLSGLQNAAGRLAALQAKMSSGQQITKPSDDPSGTVEALALRGELRRNTQYASNANDAIAWLSAADTSYTQVVTQLQSARTLVVQGLNSGASSTGSTTAIANQIDQLRSSLINLANTQYNGRPIFGGTTAGSVAYDPSGNYVGDSGVVSRTVGAQQTVQINQTGPQVFGAAGSDVFSLLSTISNDLKTNPSALSGDLTSLDAAINTVSGAQASEGAAYQRVQVAQGVQTQAGTALKTQLSTIQDIDLADMAVQVTTANTTYQAALQTTASIRQMSLLDFLH